MSDDSGADQALAHAIALDDAFIVDETLSKDKAPDAGPLSEPVTEQVHLPGGNPLVRKRIPTALANRDAWEAARKADHPLLPRVHMVYELPDQLVAICDYVEGSSLADVIATQGRIEAGVTERYLEDLCAQASELHRHGVIHRDITPGNVIIDSAGRAHLIDLGIARVHADDGTHDTTLLGTWGFAAPEQYGFAQSDARSDVYALGGVLGYCLTGVFPGDDGFSTALHDAGLVAPTLARVVEKARSFEPAQRYQGADELSDAIAAALADAEAVHTTGPADPEATSEDGHSTVFQATESPASTDGAHQIVNPPQTASPRSTASDRQAVRSRQPVGPHRTSTFRPRDLITPSISSDERLATLIRQTGVFRKILVVLVWMLAAIILWADISNVAAPGISPATRIMYVGFALIFAFFLAIIPGIDASCCICRTDFYVRRKHPWILLIARVATSVVIGFAMLFAFACIFQLIAQTVLGNAA